MRALRRLAACCTIALLTLRLVSARQAPTAYDALFTARTMRVDLWHTGGPKGEVVALDRVVSDGPWPGSRTRLIDAHEPRQLLLRGRRPRDEPADLLARLRVGVRRVGDDRRGEGSTPARSTSRCASRGRSKPVQVVLKKRDARERVPADLVDGRRSRARAS